MKKTAMKKFWMGIVGLASMGMAGSCVGCGHGCKGTATCSASGDLQLERLLHRCQRWLGTKPQLLGFRNTRRASVQRRLP